MIVAPILVLLDFNQSFQLFSNGSGVGIGAVLMQKGHPIAFFSKKFCSRMKAASTYVHELYAITSTVKKWRPYILGRHFEIIIDHKNIKKLMTQTIQMPKQHFYLAKLFGCDYSILYKSGGQNLVADALSRILVASTNQCMVLTVPHFDILQKLREETQHLEDLIVLSKA